MYSVGERLRQRREERGLGFEAVTRATKLTRTVLLALEEDRFEDLAAPVYVRGFIRIYCQHLDMPAEPLLDLYAAKSVITELLPEDLPAEPSRMPHYLREPHSRPASMTPAGAVLLAATAAIALAFMWSVSRKGKPTPVVAQQVEEVVAPATALGPQAPPPPGKGKPLPPLPGRELPHR